jgi:hypothetical protein
MRRSVRASAKERRQSLAGDELIPHPIGSLTHAVTIGVPRANVWPWLVQMGAGRAGWYSYDFVDNGGTPSAERIIPELQRLYVGAIMPWLPGATDGAIVRDYEWERHIVLDDGPRRGARPAVTWAFVLEKLAPARTRLLVRARAAAGYHPPYHLPLWTIRTLVPLGHAIMQRRQLLGIARRAERAMAPHAPAGHRAARPAETR